MYRATWLPKEGDSSLQQWVHSPVSAEVDLGPLIQKLFHRKKQGHLLRPVGLFPISGSSNKLILLAHVTVEILHYNYNSRQLCYHTHFMDGDAGQGVFSTVKSSHLLM